MIDFTKYKFRAVIDLPKNYDVYDFTNSYDPNRDRKSPYGIGKYDEKRSGMYKGELYGEKSSSPRVIHVGIDIAAPVGTPVHAFFDGEIFLFDNNAEPFDYGYTLITRHVLGGDYLWALHGHLSKKSLEGKSAGAKFKAGETIAWIGDNTENGGWNPHLHFQLSLVQPDAPDLPGVVSEEDRDKALREFPDPRLVLGPLY